MCTCTDNLMVVPSFTRLMEDVIAFKSQVVRIIKHSLYISPVILF